MKIALMIIISIIVVVGLGVTWLAPHPPKPPTQVADVASAPALPPSCVSTLTSI